LHFLGECLRLMIGPLRGLSSGDVPMVRVLLLPWLLTEHFLQFLWACLRCTIGPLRGGLSSGEVPGLSVLLLPQ
jgi:hypothetical protein